MVLLHYLLQAIDRGVWLAVDRTGILDDSPPPRLQVLAVPEPCCVVGNLEEDLDVERLRARPFSPRSFVQSTSLRCEGVPAKRCGGNWAWCKSASSQLVDRYVAAYSDPNPMNADGLKLIAAFVER